MHIAQYLLTILAINVLKYRPALPINIFVKPDVKKKVTAIAMKRYQLTLDKANILRQRFIDGEYHSWLLAKELRVSTIATWRYKREFEKIRAEYPDRLTDFGFYPGEPNRPHWQTPKWQQLCFILPVLLAEETTPTLETSSIFKKYQQVSSDSYTWRTFKGVFVKWVRDYIIPTPKKLLEHIPDKDVVILKSWRKSNDHRLWQIAKVLDMALQGASRKQIIEKVETSYRTINKWIDGYIKKGLQAFEFGPNPRNQKSVKAIKDRKEKLLKLIHETPKLHGLNRTSWSVKDLTLIFNKLYAPQVTYEQVRHCIHQMGYRYKKSREMLTSPDPKFREKINKIQRILQKLKPNEKFFSIDEYGPVSIKIKGGRTLKHITENPDHVPEKQKAKGIIICTAALELSFHVILLLFHVEKQTKICLHH